MIHRITSLRERVERPELNLFTVVHDVSDCVGELHLLSSSDSSDSLYLPGFLNVDLLVC